jgi:hypothetical protein
MVLKAIKEPIISIAGISVAVDSDGFYYSTTPNSKFTG